MSFYVARSRLNPYFFLILNPIFDLFVTNAFILLYIFNKTQLNLLIDTVIHLYQTITFDCHPAKRTRRKNSYIHLFTFFLDVSFIRDFK